MGTGCVRSPALSLALSFICKIQANIKNCNPQYFCETIRGNGDKDLGQCLYIVTTDVDYIGYQHDLFVEPISGQQIEDLSWPVIFLPVDAYKRRLRNILSFETTKLQAFSDTNIYL